MAKKRTKQARPDADVQPTRAGRRAGRTGAVAGYEAELWQMADALRGSMDAAEYKHVVLGLIFLKYVSDAFEETYARLARQQTEGADPEDPDEYRAANVFWVPPEARWTHLKAQARQSAVGRCVDDAMADVERDNPAVKDVLPKDYARPALDKERLGQLIDLVSRVKVGDEEARSKDVLGRVYEYFLSQFASAEGKKGGQFYTPRCVVTLLVEMLEPYRGRVYDPCCGSAGMFVQSVEFINAHATGNGNGGAVSGVTKKDVSIYGQESNHTTWRLAKMNLAIRGIDGQLAQGDSFLNDRHPDLKADFILANGSTSSNQSNEGGIRRSLIEANLVDCMVALPGQLFYSTQIPACLWFLARNRRRDAARARRGEILFIDARKLGRMVDRTHRELTDDDVARVAETYHAWRGKTDAGEYADVPGFCKSATPEEVRRHDHVLTPGRYVGAEAQQDDGEPFEETMQRLAARLHAQQAESARLDAAIRENLAALGFEIEGERNDSG